MCRFYDHDFAEVYLCVEGKLVEFQIFDERSGDASFLEDERPQFSVEHDRVPGGLSRLSDDVVDVQLRLPVLRPVDVVRLLK